MNRTLRPRSTATADLVSVTPAKNPRTRKAVTEARPKRAHKPELIAVGVNQRRTRSQGRVQEAISPPKRKRTDDSSSYDDESSENESSGSDAEGSFENDENKAVMSTMKTRSASRTRLAVPITVVKPKKTFEPMDCSEPSSSKRTPRTCTKAKSQGNGRKLFPEEENNLVDAFESSMRAVKTEVRVTRSVSRLSRESSVASTVVLPSRRSQRKVFSEVNTGDSNLQRERSSSAEDDTIVIKNVRKTLRVKIASPMDDSACVMKSHITPVRLRVSKTPGGTKKAENLKATRKTFTDENDDPTPIRIKVSKTPGGTRKFQTIRAGQRLNTFDEEDFNNPMRIKIKLPDEEDTLKKLATRLHLSEVPTKLPCREAEAQKLREFVRESIDKKYGESGAMYISGVPGTGKTATVRTVIESMKNDKSCPRFVYVEVSAMIFRKKVFVEIYNGIQEELSKSRGNCATPAARIAPATARQKLNTMLRREDRTRPPIVILVDELDGLCNKKQDILYDIFDWTSLPEAKVTIIAIANTLDFPERMLCQKILSRLDKRRIIFQPYEHAQIEKIIDVRLSGSKAVAPEAVQLCAKKVAGISGDLRQALDMLRRAIRCAVEDGAKQLTINHVLAAQKAVSEPYRVRMVKGLRLHKLMLFRAVLSEIQNASGEEAVYANVYRTYSVLCAALNGVEPCGDAEAYEMILQMARSSLVNLASGAADMLRRRIRLGMAVYEAEACIKAVEDIKKAKAI